MTLKSQVALKAVVAGVLPCVVWYLGWLTYDLCNFWDIMKPNEYINVLGLLMGLSVLVAVAWVQRSFHSPLHSSDRANNPEPPNSMVAWMRKTEKRLTNMEREVSPYLSFHKLHEKREKTKED